MLTLFMVFWAIAAIICGFIGIYRNNLVYKANTKASDVVFSQENWQELESTLGDYNKQIFMLNRRTFEDFYPELAKLEVK